MAITGADDHVCRFRHGFQATPRRGSSAVLSYLIPTHFPAFGPNGVLPAIKNVPVAGSKLACRLASSEIGEVKFQARPRFTVRFRGNAPIVLHEGPERFPAATGGAALEGLVVNGQAGQAEEKVRFSVNRSTSQSDHPKSVLKPSVLTFIWLARMPKPTSRMSCLPLIMSKSIVEREDVGTTDEGRKAAITQKPNSCRRTGWKSGRLIPWGAQTLRRAAIKVGARYLKNSRLAASGALRGNIVEDSVITAADLVHRVG